MIILQTEISMPELDYVNETEFETVVLQSEAPVLVDFTAKWCGPCKMVDPIVQQLAGEWGEKVRVLKCDADKNPNVLVHYGIMGIPTLLLFQGGQVTERVTGYQSRDKLSARFTPHFQ
jgi:thioredoxin 1